MGWYVDGDPDAFHKSVPNEIASLNTVTPADNDVLVIEDASDGFAKKKIAVAAIGGGGGGGGSIHREDLPPEHEDGDTFDAGALDESWTEDLSSEMQSIVKDGAWRVGCSTISGSSATASASITKLAVPAVGESVIACVEHVGWLGTSGDTGVRLALLNSSGHFVRAYLVRQSTGAHAFLAQSNTGSTSTLASRAALYAGRRIWLRIHRSNTNQWGFWVSVDGWVWAPIITGSNVTLNPDRVQIGFAAFNQSVVAGACHLFDIIDSTPPL